MTNDVDERKQPSDADRLPLGDRVRLMRDGILQNASLLASSLIGIVIVPIVLHGVGEQAYGVWLTAMSVAALAACIDFGLAMTITREVAAATPDADTSPFVVSAGNAWLVIGSVGAGVTVLAGMAAARGLGLAAQPARETTAVFALTGAGLLVDVAGAYALSVLAGLRRFDVVSALTLGNVAVRGIGIFVLVRTHAGGVVALVAWQTITTSIIAAVGLTIVARIAPAFRLRIGRLDWPALRMRTRFALTSQVASAFGVAMWRTPVIFVGVLCGASAVTPFSVGQRFPLVFEYMLWRASDVLFPALTAGAHDTAVVREVLGVGTRWTLLLALPVCLVLWILAPDLLHAWLGAESADSVLVLRITALAVLIEGVGHAAEQVLWGAALVRSVLIATAGRSVIAVALCVALVWRVGIVGAAVALLIGICIGTLLCLRLATAHSGSGMFAVLRRALSGLVVPTVAYGAVVWAAHRFIPLGGWLRIVVAVALGGASYLSSLGLGSARPEERALARQILAVPLVLFRSSKRRDRDDPPRLG